MPDTAVKDEKRSNMKVAIGVRENMLQAVPARPRQTS